MCHHSTSASSWFSCSHTGVVEMTPQQTTKCKSQIQYLFSGELNLQHMEETRRASQFSNLLHHPHMTTKNLAEFLFPSVRASAWTEPDPQSKSRINKCCQGTKWPLTSGERHLSGVLIHLALAAFTALTCL